MCSALPALPLLLPHPRQLQIRHSCFGPWGPKVLQGARRGCLQSGSHRPAGRTGEARGLAQGHPGLHLLLTAKSLCALAWVGGLWDPPLTSQTSVSWQGCEDILSRQLDSPKKKKRGTGLDPGSSVAGVRASSPASAPATVSPFPQPARFLSAATLTAFLTDSPRVGLALGQAAHKCFAGVASKETRNSYFKSRLH